ncbi:5-(carboxyamino)imidazole ribonucleotide synthase [Jeotgalibacillus proteolyticus]|uniref:N5-carboxyaminoimidazole ribonucleotide synthase n=1 Tax=Jeotgalibacillus proteolyticus TaxID=2082395 RepID=A0A2S5G7S1_9BACL|nr:5-(carboxyamino)imidazole ribonucleotide synthase [Jeotgalibacillus proteolyticus]PPA68993.1 5-(carboxyamino)imidazole ribonucleotide synthase [Jeotgalibacillus proteolyticus]
MKRILPGQTIGIIGGGQLGRMMALAAKEAGFNIAVLDPGENSPCGQVADVEIQAAFDDREALKRLAESSDVITYEFENINADALKWLTTIAHVPQGSELIRITQDRRYEKNMLDQAGVPVAPYKIIENEQDLYDKIETFGFPAVLKTSTGGYDGKGQVKLNTMEDLDEGTALITQSGPCVLESFIQFDKEVSVIVHRNEYGQTTTLPIAENIHINHILHQSIVPARLEPEVSGLAIKLALQIADQIGLVGTLAVEMFVTKTGEIYVNELAPRPHNSGHYSIEACATSQFHQHIRAICNWPLKTTELVMPVVMVNILGQHVEPVIGALDSYPNWSIHLYGKAEAKENRKMGHVTILTHDVEEALIEADGSQIWKTT